MRAWTVVVCATSALVMAACGAAPAPTNAAAAAPTLPAPCELALAPFSARLTGDDEILALQRAARSLDRGGIVAVENLAYRFVRRARVSYDAADYTRAEEAARCLESRRPGDLQATLVRGHVLHQQHRFAEAEVLAQTLVRDRGDALDFGLLGDVLMERGRVDEAVAAYQRMADLKPNFQSYSRSAHVRWLKGDLDGALEIMEKAVAAASPRDAESRAWAETRLAQYALQTKRFDLAASLLDAALMRLPDYAPALLWRGRLALAREAPERALDSLRKAAAIAQEPDYWWTLADALRASGDEAEAARVEGTLAAEGRLRDPRTFALYAATRSVHAAAMPAPPDTLVALAEREQEQRRDVFTLDATAWALVSAGRPEAAYPLVEEALALGTKDARLYYHAAVAADATARPREARRWFRDAMALQHMLLPSERQDLLSRAARAGGRRS